MLMTRAEVIAALDALVAEYDARTASAAAGYASALATVRADYEAKIAALTPPPPVELRWLPDNFPTQKAGLYVPTGFTGKGSALTTYRVRDGSSTRATEIAALVAPAVNLYNLMRAGGGGTDSPVNDVVVRGFTLLGPLLGHTYGGVFVGPGARAVVEDVVVRGIVGKLAGPPEETGSLSLWGQSHATITNVILDGRNTTGLAVASSPLMLSSVSDVTVTGLDSSYGRYGFAAALWRNAGLIRFVDSKFHHSRKTINIEQAENGAEFVFERCAFGAPTGAAYDVQVSTRNMGRAHLTFIDPVGDGPIRVKVYTSAANASAGGNGMQDNDIKVIVGGQDVTSSRLQLVH